MQTMCISISKDDEDGGLGMKDISDELFGEEKTERQLIHLGERKASRKMAVDSRFSKTRGLKCEDDSTLYENQLDTYIAIRDLLI